MPKRRRRRRDESSDCFANRGATAFASRSIAPTETELWELRHAASPILSRLDPNLQSMQFIEDCAVPPSALPAYVRGVRRILAANDTRGVIFGHAGDAHVHVNPLVDVRRPDWRERVDAILDEVTALVASLGGTLTGEHGDGRLAHAAAAARLERGRLRAIRARSSARSIRRDPESRREGRRSPGERAARRRQVRSDAAAAAERARAALERVERERAYARSRLDLLDGARRDRRIAACSRGDDPVDFRAAHAPRSAPAPACATTPSPSSRSSPVPLHDAGAPAGDWIGESTDGERLAEFAGRLCYMSQHNPAKRETREYLENIKKQGHGSVLEHANYSILLEGVSRSLTHELVRHRAGFAYSQLSQRYVDESEANFVVPPAIIGDEALENT